MPALRRPCHVNSPRGVAAYGSAPPHKGQNNHLVPERFARGHKVGRIPATRKTCHGGMGLVYKAYHPGLERVVALKRVRSGTDATAAELSRFRAEAQKSAQ